MKLVLTASGDVADAVALVLEGWIVECCPSSVLALVLVGRRTDQWRRGCDHESHSAVRRPTGVLAETGRVAWVDRVPEDIVRVVVGADARRLTRRHADVERVVGPGQVDWRSAIVRCVVGDANDDVIGQHNAQTAQIEHHVEGDAVVAVSVGGSPRRATGAGWVCRWPPWNRDGGRLAREERVGYPTRAEVVAVDLDRDWV